MNLMIKNGFPVDADTGDRIENVVSWSVDYSPFCPCTMKIEVLILPSHIVYDEYHKRKHDENQTTTTG